MWIYEIPTGTLYDPHGTKLATGYSGQPPHTNVLADTHLKGLGPIPQNFYVIGPAYTHPHLGPLTMNLDALNNDPALMFGRSQFRMHAERLVGPPGYASDGCIILDHGTRLTVSLSSDKLLRAVAKFSLSMLD